jgi:transcriptional regulator with XRE-family HTH domain
MTKSRLANAKFVPGTWHASRTAHTLLAQMAAEAEKLAAQAARIKDLRKRTRDPDTGKRLTQEALADALGVRSRSVQEWESGRGDIKPENIKALATYFKVSEEYIEYGPDVGKLMETPDPFASDPELRRQVKAIATDVKELRDALLGDGTDQQLVAGAAVRLLRAAGSLQSQADDPPQSPPADEQTGSA